MTVTFKEELRTSNLPLEELLCKHGLNLKTALKKKRRIPRKRKQEPTYIQRTKTSFPIYKSINGKQVHFGAYKSLDDAEKVVLKLKECNWDKNRLEDILMELGVERNEKSIKYTLWNAHHVRYMKHLRIKQFRLLWKSVPVPCGCFLDPVSCEVIYGLIEDAVGGE